MKKLITFAFGPLATFIFVVSCTQPATVNAQVATTTCPAGYTCTTASSSQILALIDAASPLNSVVQISPFVQTQNIPLAVYDLKSQNGTTSLQSLLVRFDIAGVNIGTPLSSLFSKIYIKVGSQTYLGTDSGGRAELIQKKSFLSKSTTFYPKILLEANTRENFQVLFVRY